MFDSVSIHFVTRRPCNGHVIDDPMMLIIQPDTLAQKVEFLFVHRLRWIVGFVADRLAEYILFEFEVDRRRMDAIAEEGLADIFRRLWMVFIGLAKVELSVIARKERLDRVQPIHVQRNVRPALGLRVVGVLAIIHWRLTL